MALEIWKPTPASVEEIVGIFHFGMVFLITANLGYGILAGLLSGFFLGFLNKHFEPYRLQKRK